VGVGVLALQQFHLRRKAAKAHLDAVVGEVRAVAGPVVRSVGLDRVAAPVCSVVAGGRAFLDAALGPSRVPPEGAEAVSPPHRS